MPKYRCAYIEKTTTLSFYEFESEDGTMSRGTKLPEPYKTVEIDSYGLGTGDTVLSVLADEDWEESIINETDSSREL